MSNAKTAGERAVPGWVLATVAVLGVVLLGYFGWRTVAGHDNEVGPPKRVYPGMYDLRAEAAKARPSQDTGAAQNGR